MTDNTGEEQGHERQSQMIRQALNKPEKPDIHSQIKTLLGDLLPEELWSDMGLSTFKYFSFSFSDCVVVCFHEWHVFYRNNISIAKWGTLVTMGQVWVSGQV